MSWGTSAGVYTASVDVGNHTSWTFVEPDPTVPYHFSVRAYDTAGQLSAYSPDAVSAPATIASLPSVSTGVASAVSPTGATIGGSAIPQGTPTTAYFQYGRTTAYGTVTPTMNLGWGLVPVSIGGGTLTMLTCGSTYHFRAVATTAVGSVAGSDGVFTTSACVPARTAISDFNGDGITDQAVFRPSTNTWWVRNQTSVAWGLAGDVPVPGDYNGDRTTDIAMYRPSNGTWFVQNQPSVQWGTSGDIPVPGDYNGDGVTDIAIYRPATGTWWVRNQFTVKWGTVGDIPVPGDYNGDGITDLAIYRPSTGAWWIYNQATITWGQAGDIPVPADYNGDGTTKIAVYRPSGGMWLVQGQPAVQWGTAGDIPAPGDFDGNGVMDIAVFRPSTGVWWVRNQFSVAWGRPGDVPLSALPIGARALPH